MIFKLCTAFCFVTASAIYYGMPLLYNYMLCFIIISSGNVFRMLEHQGAGLYNTAAKQSSIKGPANKYKAIQDT